MSDFVLVLGNLPSRQGRMLPTDTDGGRRIVFSQDGLYLEALASAHDAVVYSSLQEAGDQAICLSFGWCYRTDVAGGSVTADDLQAFVGQLRNGDDSWRERLAGTYTLVAADSRLEPFRQLDGELGDLTNVYKLDVMYVHRLANALTVLWGYSDIRTTMCPYLTAEVTDVSLRIPWRWRLGRRVLLRAIERLNPALSAIPTDKNAVMAPVRPTTLHRHAWSMAGEVWKSLVMRARRNKAAIVRATVHLPQAWRDALREMPAVDGFADPPLCFEDSLSRAEYALCCARLMIGHLTTVYPRIRRRISFDAPGPSFVEQVRLR